MKKITFLIAALCISLSIAETAFAKRDWEYWSRSSFEAPINKRISYLIKPEWRMKNDMSDLVYFDVTGKIPLKEIFDLKIIDRCAINIILIRH